MSTSASHLFRRSNTPLPQVVRAEGVWIETEDGNRYLDGSAGALVASIGHGVREVVEAQARQAGVVAYVHGTHFGVAAQEELAARLAAMAPGDLDRVYPSPAARRPTSPRSSSPARCTWSGESANGSW
jgi:adenosylmethionine-8-amino-7-oxononanoate aminotransferase